MLTTPSTAAKPSKLNRPSTIIAYIGSCLGIVIISGVLVSLLVAVPYKQEVDKVRAVQPTGDPLLDKFIQTIVDKSSYLLIADFDDTLAASSISDADYQSWKPEYGNDPRFRQLHYLTTYQRINEPDTFEDYHLDYFLHSFGTISPQEISDPQSLVLLFNIYLSIPYLDARVRWYGDEGKELGSLGKLKRICEDVFANHPQDDVYPIAMQLTQAHPEEAWGHLLLAELEFWQGNHENAIASLENFNSAENLNRLAPFPLNEYYRSLEEGTAFGNPAISGLIGDMTKETLYYVDQVSIIPMITVLHEEAFLARDLQQMDILHRFTVNLMQIKGANPSLRKRQLQCFLSSSIYLDMDQCLVNDKHTVDEDYLSQLRDPISRQFKSIKAKWTSVCKPENHLESNASKFMHYCLGAEEWSECYAGVDAANRQYYKDIQELLAGKEYQEFTSIDVASLKPVEP